MKKLKVLINKYKYALGLGAVFYIIPIIVIHFLFKWHSNNPLIVAEWSAGDILEYTGTMLGGLFAVLGVVWTMKLTTKQFFEEQRNSVKPYISFCSNNYIKDENAQSEKCISCFLRKDGGTTFSFNSFDLSECKGYKYEEVKNLTWAKLFKRDNGMFFFQFILRNNGNGIAKSFYIKDSCGKSHKTELMVGEEIKVLILMGDFERKELNYTISYENLFDDKFSININIFKENNEYEIKIER